MPLGDSITWGEGTTGDSYRAALANEVQGDGHGLDMVGGGRNGVAPDPDNEGHSGWRIDNIDGIVDSVMGTYRPNVVTLEIGTNDLGQQYQVPTAPDRLHALVDHIVRDAPDATVLVASVIVSTSSVEEPLRGPFNAAIPGIVAAEQALGRHVAYVDMSALTTGDLADALHPNDSGYRKMADAFHAGIVAADSRGWIGTPVSVHGRLRSSIAGKCLDLTSGNNANGTAIEIYGCNPTSAQDWTIAPNGTLQAAGKCLDVPGYATVNATKLEIYDCNGGYNQLWVPYNGGYRNPFSGRCLDNPGYSSTDGTQLELWDCNAGINQQWSLAPM